jgi:hypothetical protein
MENRKSFSRPKDKSLEAFKAWIQGIRIQLTGKEEDDGSMTEEKWIASWKEFWHIDDSPPSS